MESKSDKIKRIICSSDHAGFDAKSLLINYLKSNYNYEIVDVGCFENKSCDYPDFGKKLADELKQDDIGIAICSSGIGISISVNRNENCNCCLVHNEFEVETAVNRCNANVLAFGGMVLGSEVIKKLSSLFIKLKSS